MKHPLVIFLLIPLVMYSQDLSRIKLKDVDGKTYALKDHLDHKATVIIFWATWCKPCKLEFPKIKELQDKHAEKDIQVVTISQDSPRSMAKVRSFVKTHPYNFTYLLDADGQASNRLMVNQVPFTMLVNEKGKVVYSKTGYREGDELELEKEILLLFEKEEK
jgi:peroxiredoxin